MRTALLADDELEYLGWLIEYLESKDVEVVTANNCDKAIQWIKDRKFDIYIIDLNIPLIDDDIDLRGVDSEIAQIYPGLIIAKYARDFGAVTNQVFIYTVHSDKAVIDFCTKFGANYLLKGRIEEFDRRISAIIG